MALKKDIILNGIAAAAGIAVGTAYSLGARSVTIDTTPINPADVPQELERFETARHKAFNQIAKLQTKAATLPSDAAEEVSLLLDAQLAMLGESRFVRGIRHHIESAHLNAVAAVEAEITALEATFAQLDDTYIGSRGRDVRELAQRLMMNLAEQKFIALKDIPQGAIVLAEELATGDAAFLHPDRVGGFASTMGGKQSHVAILARSLRLPAVVGVADLGQYLGTIKPETIVVLDGTEGRVILNPSAATLREVETRQDAETKQEKLLARRAKRPAITADGVLIKVWASLPRVDVVDDLLALGVDGIGLFRTEYLFMNRDDLPDADEQEEAFTTLVKAMGGRPTIIRTMDVGADKQAPAIQKLTGLERNPALGLRGLRTSLAYPELLTAQFQAILRAGKHGPIQIMLPMVTSVAEILQARDLLVAVARDLRHSGVKLPKNLPPLGAMIETPAAAISIKLMAKVVDFVSIGTNDLIQYTLAVDRTNERVAPLYDPTHPAVKRLLQKIITTANVTGIPCYVCGEMAGDPEHIPFLLSIGVRNLSISAGNIPRAKEAIRQVTLTERS